MSKARSILDLRRVRCGRSPLLIPQGSGRAVYWQLGFGGFRGYFNISATVQYASPKRRACYIAYSL